MARAWGAGADQGGADGSVEGAHAVDDRIHRTQLLQNPRVHWGKHLGVEGKGTCGKAQGRGCI